MRNLLVKIIATALSFAVTRYLIAGFMLDNQLGTYLVTAIFFLLINLFIAPLIKLILLPINIITLGLFRWVVNVLVLYLFDLFYSGLTITAYQFPGYSSAFLSLPSASISLFWTLVLSSFIMSIGYTTFVGLFKEN